MNLLLRDVQVDGVLTDVTIEGDRISAIGARLPVPPDAIVVDGERGALLPGLHDHHLHLLALAAASTSVRVRPGNGGDPLGFASELRAADTRLSMGSWLRAVGYHDRTGRPLDRWVLDEIVSDRPVRVQHRSGALWVLNSAGLDALGLLTGAPPPGCELLSDGTPTGRLWRLDAWLADRLPIDPPDLGAVGRRLCALGVTGVTDATPTADTSGFDRLASASWLGEIPQRIVVTGAPGLDIGSVPSSLTVGPAKILLPDHDLPSLDELVHQMRTARAARRNVAVHCVTRHALVLTLAAIDEVGAVAGDRLEHGAVIPSAVYPAIRAHGLTVVTQPNFVAERGDDYLAEVAREDLGDLWPCASLLDAGVAVGAGSDAPFGDEDPWRLIHAASQRRAPSGATVGADERIPAARALEMLLSDHRQPGGPVRRIKIGAPGDLCLLHTSLSAALAALPDNPVRAVVIRGCLHEPA